MRFEKILPLFGPFSKTASFEESGRENGHLATLLSTVVYSVVEYRLVPHEGTISIRAFFAKHRCLSLIEVDFQNRCVPKSTKVPASATYRKAL
jgi:hypothetical protein